MTWAPMRNRRDAWLAKDTFLAQGGVRVSVLVTLYRFGEALFSYNAYIETDKAQKTTHAEVKTDALETAQAKAERAAQKMQDECLKSHAAALAARRRKTTN